MYTKLAETQLWQRNLASLIRSGLFTRAETGASNGLFTVVGVYGDGTYSAPLAKYADSRRAADAAELANTLARADRMVEAEWENGRVGEWKTPRTDCLPLSHSPTLPLNSARSRRIGY